jgi:hypothetical protein
MVRFVAINPSEGEPPAAARVREMGLVWPAAVRRRPAPRCEEVPRHLLKKRWLGDARIRPEGQISTSPQRQGLHTEVFRVFDAMREAIPLPGFPTPPKRAVTRPRHRGARKPRRHRVATAAGPLDPTLRCDVCGNRRHGSRESEDYRASARRVGHEEPKPPRAWRE